MRILFQARDKIESSQGGDAVQLRFTRKYLMERGVQVDVDSSLTCDCSSYDIVHLFNITRPHSTYHQLINAKRYGKPVCLSTIYWNMDALRHEVSSHVPRWLLFARLLRSAGMRLKALFNAKAKSRYDEKVIMESDVRIKRMQSEVIHGVDMLLPNSYAELQLLKRDFKEAYNKPAFIVNNCIDLQLFTANTCRTQPVIYNLFGNDFALCVGRIETRKNQIRVARAMATINIPVVFVGSVASQSYYKEVLRNLKRPSRILDEIEQEDLPSLYRQARVHILASLYETPGLSSLEAGAMGCNLVMSNIGCQQEYFGDCVEYCDPLSEIDIARAVRKAWLRPWPNNKLANDIRNKFSWDIASKQTHEAYLSLLLGSQARKKS